MIIFHRVDQQLAILEAQYLACVQGKTLPSDSPIGLFNDISLHLDELSKRTLDFLPKPIDVVGDGNEGKSVKKTKKTKRGAKANKGEKNENTEKKKQWTREEILSTFLPPDRQLKGRRKTAKQTTPANSTTKREKKPLPTPVIKEKEESSTQSTTTTTTTTTTTVIDEGKKR